MTNFTTITKIYVKLFNNPPSCVDKLIDRAKNEKKFKGYLEFLLGGDAGENQLESFLMMPDSPESLNRFIALVSLYPDVKKRLDDYVFGKKDSRLISMLYPDIGDMFMF